MSAAHWLPLNELAGPADAARAVARQDDGGLLTHADLLARVGRWQHAFAAQSHPSWAIYSTDPFDFAAALFGAWHAGKAVAVPGDDRPATLQALMDAGYRLAGEGPDALQASASAPADDEPRQPLDAHSARLIVFTSGSQGQPEGIPKGLHQFMAETCALEAAFGSRLTGPDGMSTTPTVWATVSHQHIYGLLFLVLWPLAAGRPFGLRRLLYPEDIASCLGAAPSVLVSSPAHLRRLGDQVNWPALHAPLRAVFSSGGPLPFEVACSAAQALGHVPLEVFGSSETGGIAWRQSTQADQPWQALQGVQWRLEGEHLAVRSPHLPDGGWLLTSDRAQTAGGGSFRLLGRADRIVKIEEKRVSLQAVERQLLATPWIQDARPMVVPTPVGARIGVVTVLTPAGQALLRQGRRALTDALRQTLSSALETLALPKRWRFVDELPTNAQGKSPESLLSALFADPLAANPTALPEVHWLSRSDTQALAVLAIDASLPVFDGHFEIAPILPGVAQLAWALALGRECFDLPAHFLRLEALKFVRPVHPGTRLHLSLQVKPVLADAQLSSLHFRLYSEDPAGPSGDPATEHTNGRAVWSRAPEAAHG